MLEKLENKDCNSKINNNSKIDKEVQHNNLVRKIMAEWGCLNQGAGNAVDVANKQVIERMANENKRLEKALGIANRKIEKLENEKQSTKKELEDLEYNNMVLIEECKTLLEDVYTYYARGSNRKTDNLDTLLVLRKFKMTNNKSMMEIVRLKKRLLEVNMSKKRLKAMATPKSSYIAKSPLEVLIQKIVERDEYTGLPTSVLTKLVNLCDKDHNNYSEIYVGKVLCEMYGANIGKSFKYAKGTRPVRVLDPNVKDWKKLIKTDRLESDLMLAELRIRQLSSPYKFNFID